MRDELDTALWALNRIEADASPALRKEMQDIDRFRMAHTRDKATAQAIRQRLGHRAGLLRLLRHEAGRDDPQEPSDRSKLYLGNMLAISANVAILSGSGWGSTLRWFERRLSTMTKLVTPEVLRGHFEAYRAEAALYLSGQVRSIRAPLLWGPSPAEIATDFEITTAQLRAAKANRCGLTSVDPESPKERDRRRKEEARRAAGRKPQPARTKTVEMAALAERLGCCLRTVQRRAKAGTLAALIAERDVAKVSPVEEKLTADRFVTPPAPANDDEPDQDFTETLPLVPGYDLRKAPPLAA